MRVQGSLIGAQPTSASSAPQTSLLKQAPNVRVFLPLPPHCTLSGLPIHLSIPHIFIQPFIHPLSICSPTRPQTLSICSPIPLSLYPAAHPHPSIGLPSVCQVFLPPEKCLVQCQELVAQGCQPCGLSTAGGPFVLLGCMFARCDCTFPHGTSCSGGGGVGWTDCALCPPGEAHRTPISTFPCLACW